LRFQPAEDVVAGTGLIGASVKLPHNAQSAGSRCTANIVNVEPFLQHLVNGACPKTCRGDPLSKTCQLCQASKCGTEPIRRKRRRSRMDRRSIPERTKDRSESDFRNLGPSINPIHDSTGEVDGFRRNRSATIDGLYTQATAPIPTARQVGIVGWRDDPGAAFIQAENLRRARHRVQKKGGQRNIANIARIVGIDGVNEAIEHVQWHRREAARRRPSHVAMPSDHSEFLLSRSRQQTEVSQQRPNRSGLAFNGSRAGASLAEVL
jgi:hypothetical protein